MDQKDNIITLTDNDTGEELEFEVLGWVKYNNKDYCALVPQKGNKDEYVILRDDTPEGSEDVELVSVDDDDEFDAVDDLINDELLSEIDYDA